MSVNEDIIHNSHEEEVVNNIAELVEEIYDMSDDVGFQTTEEYIWLTKMHDRAEEVGEEISDMYEDNVMNDTLEWHIEQIHKLVWEIYRNARLVRDEVQYTVEHRSFETDGKMFLNDHGISMLFGALLDNITLYSVMAKEHVELLLNENNDTEANEE